MALITTANLVGTGGASGAGKTSLCDSLASAWTQLLTANSKSSVAAPAVGSIRGTLYNLQQNVVTLLGDVSQETDLVPYCNAAFVGVAADTMMIAAGIRSFIQAIQQDIKNNGALVAASIIDLNTYLNYYNGGSGGAKFANMVTQDFLDLYNSAQAFGNALTYPNIISPAIQPDYNPAATNGFGIRTPGGSFTAGQSINFATYAELIPVIEVTSTISGGTGAIAVTLNGTDDQNNAATWGPVTLTGNNPVGPLSGVTVTPAITAYSRQTVALSSATGIVTGSVLTINKNKPDQEVVVVEAVSGSNITAVFKVAHAGSATVDGWNSYAAGSASTGAGRRLRVLTASTGITFSTINGQNAGVVRVSGSPDRVAI